MKDFTGKIKAYRVLAKRKCCLEDPTKRREWINIFVLKKVADSLDPRAILGPITKLEDKKDHSEYICVFCKKEITGDVFVLPKCLQYTHKFCYEEERLVWEFCLEFSIALGFKPDAYGLLEDRK